MNNKRHSGIDKWAKLRFSIIGALLASPPERGDLQLELETLAAKPWKHPVKNEWIRFDVSTIERWYYKARRENDPIQALMRCPRSDIGTNKDISPELMDALQEQYLRHPGWTYALHAENVMALSYEGHDLGHIPSYATINRLMKSKGWYPKKRLPRNATEGQIRAIQHREKREVRGYESPYVHGLWHLDFHTGKRSVLDDRGTWRTPHAFCVIDDHSRLCCHIQWYFGETAQILCHGLMQAFMKRGLPRALMTDNGSAMLAHETRNGLETLGVLHQLTLAYSPYQNGKQESFWGNLEGRLMKMLEDKSSMTIGFLNLSTQAWVELEYNKRVHREIGCMPLDRTINGTSVARECPDVETLKLAFCTQIDRTQRRTDGTITIEGVRFEIPSHYRHVEKLAIRYQSWDLSVAYLVDSRTGQWLTRIHPQNKAANAHGMRKTLEAVIETTPHQTDTIAPLLRKYIADYAATGLPPAYIDLDEISESEDTHE